MKKAGFLSILMVILSSLLISCAINHTVNITAKLPSVFDRKYLNDKTSVQPVDLLSGARCPGTKTLHVVSKDKRTNQYTVYNVDGVSFTIIPSEYTQIVAQYMEDKLRESNVKVDEGAGKEINVWMEEIHADGAWTFGCDVKLKVNIPEIDYTKIYSGHEGSAIIMNAIGYATNLALTEFLKDPIVQEYIQCTKE